MIIHMHLFMLLLHLGVIQSLSALCRNIKPPFLRASIIMWEFLLSHAALIFADFNNFFEDSRNTNLLLSAVFWWQARIVFAPAGEKSFLISFVLNRPCIIVTRRSERGNSWNDSESSLVHVIGGSEESAQFVARNYGALDCAHFWSSPPQRFLTCRSISGSIYGLCTGTGWVCSAHRFGWFSEGTDGFPESAPSEFNSFYHLCVNA